MQEITGRRKNINGKKKRSTNTAFPQTAAQVCMTDTI